MYVFVGTLFCGFALISLLGCGKVDAELNTGIKEMSVINVFSLVTHKQTGSCAKPPIRHRYISFQVFEHPMEGDDIFLGILDLALDDSTKTYMAHYREIPSEMNINQTTYSKTLNGTYVIDEVDNKDYLTLSDLGVVTPTAYGERIKFDIKLNGPIHRQIVRDTVGGFVMNGSTRIFDDSCPP